MGYHYRLEIRKGIKTITYPAVRTEEALSGLLRYWGKKLVEIKITKKGV